MMLPERLNYLLERLETQSASKEEYQELREMLNMDASEGVMERLQSIYPFLSQSTTDPSFRIPYWQEILQQILTTDKLGKSNTFNKPVHRVHFLRRGWFRYAAAVVICIGVGAYLGTTNKKADQTLASGNKQLQTDISPGGDKAVLTLADGSKIILDSAANGQLANQGGVKVIKSADGQISYDLKGLASKEVMWNTMSTPKGGQYQVTLPDGTKVWLNAASSITFPTAFTGAERKVKIDGEVYFEVSQNKQQPFLVDIHGESLIQVLGTRFNVNSYQNENVIRTTLVEGSVKIVAASKQAVLKPGQQATIAIAASSDRQSENSAGISVTSDADIDQVLAWKNGYFNFQDLDTYAVMRQLERWYDIKVRFEGKVNNTILQGRMLRNTNLSDVIELLNNVNVRCRLEGKTLVAF